MVGFNTENPPGREVECAAFILDQLRAMGCRAEAVDVEPGRTNVAGIFENGPGPAFAFNTHIDVVPAGDGWQRGPFSGEVADEALWGRGAIDDKSLGIAHLTALVELRRSGVALSRDVIFLALLGLGFYIVAHSLGS